MAVGKSKKVIKNRKGGKKRVVDPFTRKDWYTVKAPNYFKSTSVGKTPVNKTSGNKLSIDGLKGRVYEINLADLQTDVDLGYRTIKLKALEVRGRDVLTGFYGMRLTTDKLRMLVKKWQTTIEAHIDVRTTDDYVLRLFCIAFTSRRPGQVRKTSYAQSSQKFAVRRKMMEVMRKEVEASSLRQFVEKLIPESIGKRIEKECIPIFPITNCIIRKVKVLKSPKFDIHKLLEVHTGGSSVVVEDTMKTVSDSGEVIDRMDVSGTKK
jgi:small subunit ribosomal protein S3Ae